MRNIISIFVVIFFIFGILPTMLYSLSFLYAQEGVLEEKVTNKEVLIKYKNSPTVEKRELKKNETFEEFYSSNFDEDVEYIEPNFIYHATLIPNDTYYSNQWYLEKIKAPYAWEKANNGENVVIAIIDSSIQIEHPDLKNNIWQNTNEIIGNGIDDDKNGFIDDRNGWDFINNTPDPSPRFDDNFTEEGIMHGTIIAGIAAATGNNNKGIAGIAWNTKIMALRVLNDKGEGRTSEVIRAIDYAITNGADIINFSFVGFGYSEALNEAITRAYKAGIIIVAAAGNEQEEGEGYNLDTSPMYPVCHDGKNGENMVIGVAASDTIDQKTKFSSFGFNCVDITAPGVSIFSTVVFDPSKKVNGKIFDKYYDGYWSGTSMSVPIVSGGAALLIQANPEIKRKEAIEILLGTADNISRLNPNYLGQLGSGRINLKSAVDMALERYNNQEVNIIISPLGKRISDIKLTDKKGEVMVSFNAYGKFMGGATVASGDINGDGVDEIITGAGPGGGPHVRIFNNEGEVLNQFFAFSDDFRGGVNVASGDVDGDGIDEIIVAQGKGGTSLIKIYRGDGKEILNQFLTYHPSFRGGVNIASGDINGDGVDEIITGAGQGGGPQVRMFDLYGNVKGQFFAYAQEFRGGVQVAVADIDGGSGREKDEIIVGAGIGGGPHVRIFDDHAILKDQFFAYDKSFRGGISVSAGDIDGDGLAEIVTGAGAGGAPHVRTFESNGELISSYYSYEEVFNGGINVGVIRVKK